MVPNIKFCCRQCLRPQAKFYVEIRNQCSEYLNATIYYTLYGKDIVKPSPPFAPGKYQRIVFPDSALCIFLQVFRTSFKPPKSICTIPIPNNMISRYKIQVEHSDKFMCIKI